MFVYFNQYFIERLQNLILTFTPTWFLQAYYFDSRGRDFERITKTNKVN